MKKISVLIPTYKPDWYLERCLHSIEAQTLSKNNFKVYIALNGKKNGYEQYVGNLLEKCHFYYEYIYIEEASVSNSRNVLIEKSIEDYITFLDDDDVLSPTYLESLLAVSSEYVVGISNIYNFERNINERKPNYIGDSFFKLPALEKSKFKSRKYFSSPCAKLIHRNIIGETRFNRKLDMGEDALFMTMISSNVKAVMKSDSEAIYYVFERANSLSRKKIQRSYEIKRIVYLLMKYSVLFAKAKKNHLFIATRFAATLKFIRRLF
ncbi:glycosyltransferase [Aliivibrio fischeri]|uniref:glycosyltransferase family A protein n=1 Tax=Aliivibrio fischeri TaxID=668 RepID=UPI0012D8C92C|nr:glycosyltransferase family A protein [Aliivibrio fischeri]MUK92239.1 glycosyltransferase [Aliivibrio fischeri]